MNDAPLISIIICTCSRAADLRQTLAAIGALCVPADMPTELLVVDNASTDSTAEVVQQCRLPNMPVRYVLEPRRGKGYAYNRGMAEAQGEVFLFTDDDVRPPADWIAGMCGPILRGEADAVAGGVALAPALQRDWMTPRHQDWLASTQSIPQEPMPRLVGANMAFSRRVLEKVPEFDTEIGPGALGFADDTLFTYQLLKAGYRVTLALDVCVEHHFEKSRLLRESFLSSSQKMGRSMAYLGYHWEHHPDPVTLRHVLGPALRLLLWRVRNARHGREGITETEMLLVERCWFVKQYRQEQRQPRRYAQYGLRKLVHD